jgi:hypothetical protein
MKLVQLTEKFIRKHNSLTEFKYDHQLGLSLPQRYDPAEKRVQRFQEILEQHSAPTNVNVLALIELPSVAFVLHYLGRRLRVGYDDDPSIILARFLLCLDSELLPDFWRLLKETSTLDELPVINDAVPRYKQIDAYTIEACKSMIQLLAPHLPNGKESVETQIMDALGSTDRSILDMLQRPPTLKRLFLLHKTAQLCFLKRVAQDWPPNWLEYDAIQPGDVAILDHALGRILLDYVESLSDLDTIRDHLRDLPLPDDYADVLIDDDQNDPFSNIPPDCEALVEVGDDVYESFVFSTPEATKAFSWFMSDRQRYSIFLGTEPSWFYDPLHARTAFELRKVMLEEYAAPLPPDTFPVYLNLAFALSTVTVPEDWLDGGLPLLSIEHLGTMEVNQLALVLANDEHIFWPTRIVLSFEHRPVNFYIVVSDNGEENPVALILTTDNSPGKLERHRKQQHFTISSSEWISLLILRSLKTAKSAPNLMELDRLSEKYYENLDSSWGKFTKLRRSYFLNLVDSLGRYSGPVTVYILSDGYMLQFDPRYTFTPNQMQIT